MAEYGISEAQFREYLEDRLHRAATMQIELAYLEFEIIKEALESKDTREFVDSVYDQHEHLQSNPWHEDISAYNGMHKEWLTEQLYDCVRDDIAPVCERLMHEAGGLFPSKIYD